MKKMTSGLNHLTSIQMDIKYKPSTELPREGGIALITKDKAKFTTLDTNNYTSFEHKAWNAQFKSKPTYTITGIYHPHLTAKQMTIIQHSWINSLTF